jgi:hypothetical protein
MNIINLIAELRNEQQQIDQAILALQALGATSGAKRRGRPPKWLSEAKQATAPAPEKKRTRVVSAATRRKMAEAQQRRAAARKAEQAETASGA